jgi:hypothetical protein
MSGRKRRILAREIVPNARDLVAVEDPARRYVGDDDVVDVHLFERQLGVLRVCDAVRVIRVRHADHDVAEGVMHVTAGRHETRVPNERPGDGGIELHSDVKMVATAAFVAALNARYYRLRRHRRAQLRPYDNGIRLAIAHAFQQITSWHEQTPLGSA